MKAVVLHNGHINSQQNYIEKCSCYSELKARVVEMINILLLNSSRLDTVPVTRVDLS